MRTQARTHCYSMTKLSFRRQHSVRGFVTLFGITMRHSIMMISPFDHLVREEGMTWGLETALRGASERVARSKAPWPSLSSAVWSLQRC